MKVKSYIRSKRSKGEKVWSKLVKCWGISQWQHFSKISPSIIPIPPLNFCVHGRGGGENKIRCTSSSIFSTHHNISPLRIFWIHLWLDVVCKIHLHGTIVCCLITKTRVILHNKINDYHYQNLDLKLESITIHIWQKCCKRYYD